MNRNARMSGMIVILVLVVLALLYFSRASQPPAQKPNLDNVPPLGQVPTQEQIENRPPK